MGSSIFSRELMTVDLQMRQDQINSLDQFIDAALGMPEGLVRGNKSGTVFRRSLHDATVPLDQEHLSLCARGFFS